MADKLLIVNLRSDSVEQDTVEIIRQQIQAKLPNHDVAIILTGKDESVSVTEITK